MFIAQEIKDYQIYDTGDGMKLESWAGKMCIRDSFEKAELQR